MGFWKSLKVLASQNSHARVAEDPHMKIALIRDLVRRRAPEETVSQLFDNPHNVTEEVLLISIMGLPEATILTIVENQLLLEAEGLSEVDIFNAQESHRSSAGTGDIPKNLTLFKYIKYRLTLEHPQASLSDDEIQFCINAARKFF